jgi:hypothetical protein
MEQKDPTGISVKRPDYKNVPSPWGDDVEEALTAQRQVEEKKAQARLAGHIVDSNVHSREPRPQASQILRLLLALYWFVSRKSKFLVHCAVERKAVPRWMGRFQNGREASKSGKP